MQPMHLTARRLSRRPLPGFLHGYLTSLYHRRNRRGVSPNILSVDLPPLCSACARFDAKEEIEHMEKPSPGQYDSADHHLAHEKKSKQHHDCRHAHHRHLLANGQSLALKKGRHVLLI